MKVSRAAVVRSEHRCLSVSKRPVVFVLPVRCARHQVRPEGLQGSNPPAAAHLQQRHHRRGRQSQAAHRLRSSERSSLTLFLHVLKILCSWKLTPRPAGISVSSLSDGLFVLHVPTEDNKQKVSAAASFWMNLSGRSGGLHGLPVSSQGDVILQSDHVIETLTKIAICADKINNININQGRWGAERVAPREPTSPAAVWLRWCSSTASSLHWVRGKKGPSTSRRDRSSSWPRRRTDTCLWWGERTKTLCSHENPGFTRAGGSRTRSHVRDVLRMVWVTAGVCVTGCDAFFSPPSLADGAQTELQMITAHPPPGTKWLLTSPILRSRAPTAIFTSQSDTSCHHAGGTCFQLKTNKNPAKLIDIFMFIYYIFGLILLLFKYSDFIYEAKE